MLSDHIFNIAGHSLTISSHDQVMAALSIFFGLLLWTVLYFHRRRVVIIRRSSGTDQIAYELSRLADAMERIANRPANRAISAGFRQQEPESRGIPLSMFGR